MLKSLGRTTVLVRDYDEAAEFFCGRLGFERLHESLRPDGQRLLHLGLPDQPAGRPPVGLWLLEPATPEERALIGRQTGGQPLFVVYTDDCRGTAAALQASGVQFRELPRIEDGSVVADFFDLYGNDWMLVELLPALAQPAPDPAVAFAARIHTMAPDLVVHSATYNGEGTGNDVVIVNDSVVFRFAKGERGVASLAGELKVLRAIRAHGPLAIPDPFYANPTAVAYELLRGEPLSRHRLLGLDPASRQAIANQLGDFLRGLHSASVEGDLPATRARAHYAEWVELRREVEESIYPLLMGHEQARLQSLFDSALGDPRRLDYEPRLIHGDLWPEHILFDGAAGRLSGIIDFGMAGVGDAATDLGNLLQVYGESFVQRLFTTYPAAAGLMPRARFYAQTLELDWSLRGLASGDKFWFTAHLGGARDLLPAFEPAAQEH